MVLWETQECTGLSGIRNIARYVARRKDVNGKGEKQELHPPDPAPPRRRAEEKLSYWI